MSSPEGIHSNHFMYIFTRQHFSPLIFNEWSLTVGLCYTHFKDLSYGENTEVLHLDFFTEIKYISHSQCQLPPALFMSLKF